MANQPQKGSILVAGRLPPELAEKYLAYQNGRPSSDVLRELLEKGLVGTAAPVVMPTPKAPEMSIEAFRDWLATQRKVYGLARWYPGLMEQLHLILGD